jgi:hypothetical protein
MNIYLSNSYIVMNAFYSKKKTVSGEASAASTEATGTEEVTDVRE